MQQSVPETAPRHKPPPERAIIVTAWIHEDDLHGFNRLRERFFPRVRAFASAHVTLFHHLPGPQRERVLAILREEIARFTHDDLDLVTGVARATTSGVFRMNRGTGYALGGTLLAELRAPLRDRFADVLRPQDAAPWRNPHITVMNKTSAAQAERLTRHLAARYEPCALRVLGLQAWRYDYGPWSLIEEIPFAARGSGGDD